MLLLSLGGDSVAPIQHKMPGEMSTYCWPGAEYDMCEGEKKVIYAENKKIWSTISKIFVHPKRGSKSEYNYK